MLHFPAELLVTGVHGRAVFCTGQIGKLLLQAAVVQIPILPTANLIDQEVKDLLDAAYAKCREILERDRDKLELVAQFLLEHETMDARQFQLAYDNPAALMSAGDGTER